MIRSDSGSHIEIPIQGPESPSPHHQPSRLPGREVKESFSTGISKFLCSCLLALLFFLGLVSFILWLGLRPHRPRFYLRSFSVAGLAKGSIPKTVSFNISIQNSNANADFYFDEMGSTVFYLETPLGRTAMLYALHEAPKRTAEISGVLTGTALNVSAETWRRIQAASTAVFRIDLSSRIRFRVLSFETGWHRVQAACDAEVGADGNITAAYENRSCTLYFS